MDNDDDGGVPDGTQPSQQGVPPKHAVVIKKGGKKSAKAASGGIAQIAAELARSTPHKGSPGLSRLAQSTLAPNAAGKLSYSPQVAFADPLITAAGSPALKPAPKSAIAGSREIKAAGTAGKEPIPCEDLCLEYHVKKMFPDLSVPVADWRTLFPSDVFQFPDVDVPPEERKVKVLRLPMQKDFKNEWLEEYTRIVAEYAGEESAPHPSDEFRTAQVSRVTAAWEKLGRDANTLLFMEACDKVAKKIKADEKKAREEAKAAKAAAAEAKKEALGKVPEALRVPAASAPLTAPAVSSSLAALSPPIQAGGRRKVAEFLHDRTQTAHMIARCQEHIRYQSDVIDRLHDRLRKAMALGQRLYFLKVVAEELAEGRREFPSVNLAPRITGALTYFYTLLKVRIISISGIYSSYIIYLLIVVGR